MYFIKYTENFLSFEVDFDPTIVVTTNKWGPGGDQYYETASNDENINFRIDSVFKDLESAIKHASSVIDLRCKEYKDIILGMIGTYENETKLEFAK